MKKIVLSLILVSLCFSAHISLSKLNVNLSGTTVSGISSGAMMAGQFHVAHSKYVKGSAIIAGGPVGCAQGFLTVATGLCMDDPFFIDFSLIEAGVYALADLKKIDPLKNIANSKVYIFNGLKDTVVNPKSGQLANKQFSQFGANVLTEFSIPAEHSFISNLAKNACDYLGDPYINNCNYDQAFISLNHLYDGSLTKPTTQAIQDNLFSFDQTKYFSSYMSSLWNEGYIYIPTACQAGGSLTCKFHIDFHGCEQSAENIGMEYINQIGINMIAEANNIVVLYPQITTNSLFPFNPKGCWDWWGYSEWSSFLAPFGYYMINSAGFNYFSKEGLQIEAIWKMAQKIGSIQDTE